jgi:hypothetical protein
MHSYCKVLVPSLIALFIIAAIPTTVQATHFRYGQINWTPGSGNTIKFEIDNAWRRNGYSLCYNTTSNTFIGCTGPGGFPGPGDVISEGVGGTIFNLGDGNTVSSPTGFLLYLVTSIDPANNWLFATALNPASLPAKDTVITHTYAKTGDYLADIASCCRISALQAPNAHINNPDGNYKIETIVNVGTGNISPVSNLPPIVNCPINAICSFIVPASDADGDSLTFRLSNSTEAGLGFIQPGIPNAPHNASINSLTGVYTWNTTGATLGPAGFNTLYSTQVTIEDHNATGGIKSKIAVDFLIQLVPFTSEAPPLFVAPTPTCGSTKTVAPGSTISFIVNATDANATDQVILNAAGVPGTATLTPSLPTTGNPVSTNFTWTPSVSDVGSHIVTFTATDLFQQQALCSITINITTFVIPELPFGTILALLLPIAALVIYTKVKTLTPK